MTTNAMTDDRSDIERIVMQRVRRISWLRLIISGVVFSLATALLALYAVGREVWVAKVFENGPQDPFGHFLYFVYAFEHTRFIVQALVVLALVSFLYLAKEVAATIAAVREENAA